MEFKNLGDVNYLVYGGNLVWKPRIEDISSEDFNYTYYVFELYTPWHLGENKYVAHLYYIDIRDYEAYKDELLEQSIFDKDISWEELMHRAKEDLASEIVTLGIEDIYTTYKGAYPCRENEVLSYSEVKSWLRDLGIDVSKL